MKVSVIAAMSHNHVIGNEAGLPWRLPRDLRRFRDLTWGKPVIVGRKTIELIGAPLKGRQNIVLTRNRSYEARGFHVAHEVGAALYIAGRLLQQFGGEEAMVIGGADVYRQLLPRVERVYLTIVEGEFPGTAFFPAELPAGREWSVTHREYCPADDRNLHAHHFYILERRLHPAAGLLPAPAPLASVLCPQC
jgi:dihydrofolate reductase